METQINIDEILKVFSLSLFRSLVTSWRLLIARAREQLYLHFHRRKHKQYCRCCFEGE